MERVQQPEPVVPMPVPVPEPVVAEPFRLEGPPEAEPVLAPAPVWLVPGVELFADSEPDEPVAEVPVAELPNVAPPVAAVVHGIPLAPIRPALLEFEALPEVLPGVPGLAGLLGLVELAAVLGFEVPGLVALGFIVLWLMALGFEALGFGLAGVVAVLPVVLLAPPVAPELAPAELPPPAEPPLPPPPAAIARPVLLRRMTESNASLCLICGISDSCASPQAATSGGGGSSCDAASCERRISHPQPFRRSIRRC